MWLIIAVVSFIVGFGVGYFKGILDMEPTIRRLAGDDYGLSNKFKG